MITDFDKTYGGFSTAAGEASGTHGTLARDLRIATRRTGNLVRRYEMLADANGRTLAFAEKKNFSRAVANFTFEENARLRALEQAVKKISDRTSKIVAGLGAVKEETVLAQSKRVASDAANATLYAYLLLLGIAAVAVIASWKFAVSLTQPFVAAVKFAKSIADGDLREQLKLTRNDEIGELGSALDGMVLKLRGIVGSLDSTGLRVSSASQELSASTTEFSAQISSTSDLTVSVSSAVEELALTVRVNADKAKTSSSAARSAQTSATDGKQVVLKAVESIRGVKRSTARIADASALIKDIAFETNLLALNAAVEAARAGEAGKGFAIVAAQVRRLAERSAEANQQIKALTETVVEAVEESVDHIDRADNSLEDIVGRAGEVAQGLDEISAASSEQSEGVANVAKSIREVERMTQENSAIVKENAAAASALQNDANRMRQVTAHFRTDTADTPPTPGSAPPDIAQAANPGTGADTGTDTGTGTGTDGWRDNLAA